MARAFDDGSSQYLINATALRSAYPVTFAGWFYLDDLSSIQTMMAISDEAGTVDYIGLIFDPGTGDYIYAQQRATGYSTTRAESAATISVNTWFHGCAVFENSTDRRIYLTGGSKGSNTDTIIFPIGADNTTIGTLKRTSAGIFLSGYGAECGIWSVGLTDTEAAALGTGIRPIFVRPQSLVSYWDIMGNLSPEPDWLENRYNMTLVNGPTKADHPPVIYPVSPQIIHAPAGVSPVSINISKSADYIQVITP